MDSNEIVETEDLNFGKEIAKTIIVSAAATAGAMVGILALGFVHSKIEDFRLRRAAKKAADPEE